MSDIKAVRDLVIIAGIAYVAWKLKDPFAKAKDTLQDIGRQAQQSFYFYSSGGELRKAWEEEQVDKSRGEVVDQAGEQWTEEMKKVFGKDASDVTFEERKEVPAFEEWEKAGRPKLEVLQGTVELQPDTTEYEITPEQQERALEAVFRKSTEILTLGGIEYEKRSGFWMSRQSNGLFKTSSNQGLIQRLFETSSNTFKEPETPAIQVPAPGRSSSGGGMSIAPSLVPFTGGGVPFLASLQPQSRAPIRETRPLGDMTSQQAASEGYKYSGAVGWYK